MSRSRAPNSMAHSSEPSNEKCLCIEGLCNRYNYKMGVAEPAWCLPCPNKLRAKRVFGMLPEVYLAERERILLIHNPPFRVTRIHVKNSATGDVVTLPFMRSVSTNDYTVLVPLSYLNGNWLVIRGMILEAFGLEKGGIDKIIDYYGRNRVLNLDLSKFDYSKNQLYSDNLIRVEYKKKEYGNVGHVVIVVES